MNSAQWQRNAVLACAAAGVTGIVGGYLYQKKCHKYVSRRLPKTIVVCSSVEDFEKIGDVFCRLCHETGVLGLDSEWTTVQGHRHRVALLQLAPNPNFSILVRLCQFNDETSMVTLPESLRDILRDVKIIKVGVGVIDDAHKLLTDYAIDVWGCLDLRHALGCLPDLGDFPKAGLRSLSEALLGVSPDKSWRIRCSNWEADVLTDDQIRYAADDALLSVQIFDQMIRNRLTFMQYRPGWYNRLKEDTIAMCLEAVDIPFQSRSKVSPSPQKTLNPEAASKKLGCFRSYMTLKTPLYDNCVLQAPDGEPLCTCDYKKATWYVEKKLGKVVSEPDEPDRLVVRLNFEPSNRPVLDSQYYIQAKDNKCVVCGSAESLLRKNVVPHEYRKYFPQAMKHHISHDILLLCVRCHQLSNLRDMSLRYALAQECDAPIESGNSNKCTENPELRKMRSAARALLQNLRNKKLPKDRAAVLEGVLKSHYGVDRLTEGQLRDAADIDTKVYNAGYVPHGLKVVEHYKKNEGLVHFEFRWRQHFLEVMKPNFLPSLWSVDHHREVLALKFAQGRVKDSNLSEIGITQELVDSVLEKVGFNPTDNGVESGLAED
ncbi:unnamed protein product [Ixodes hexagonus]